MAARPRTAGVAAPLVAATAFWLMLMLAEPSFGRVDLVGGGRAGGLLLLLAISVPVAAATMVVFAVPAALLLRRLGWWSRWTAILLGALAGLVAASAAFSVPELIRVRTLAVFALTAGALGGICFAMLGMVATPRTPAS
ncbi:MAG: hypothetical protein KJZ74_15385 [Gemmatimonadales bacterium]|nr:hypothetical protein [Gemmatimonadales bacterium]